MPAAGITLGLWVLAVSAAVGEGEAVSLGLFPDGAPCGVALVFSGIEDHELLERLKTRLGNAEIPATFFFDPAAEAFPGLGGRLQALNNWHFEVAPAMAGPGPWPPPAFAEFCPAGYLDSGPEREFPVSGPLYRFRSRSAGSGLPDPGPGPLEFGVSLDLSHEHLLSMPGGDRLSRPGNFSVCFIPRDYFDREGALDRIGFLARELKERGVWLATLKEGASWFRARAGVKVRGRMEGDTLTVEYENPTGICLKNAFLEYLPASPRPRVYRVLDSAGEVSAQGLFPSGNRFRASLFPTAPGEGSPDAR